jgi:hypothetical protein
VRKAIVLSVVSAIVVAAIYVFCYRPWHCNSVVASVAHSTNTAVAQKDTWEGRRLAEANARAIRECIDYSEDDVNARMLLALNLRIAGALEAAAAQYQEALRWDRRPELYLELGNTQLALGKRDAAIENLAQAVAFSPALFNDIEDAEARIEIERRIGNRLAGIGNLVRNGDFTARNRFGAAQFAGSGGGPPSIAAAWSLYNTQPGSVRGEIVSAEQFGRPGSALHVQAAGKDSGVTQIWGPAGSGPAAAVTSAWVYIVKGRASIGSGSLGYVSPDAISTSTGRWEKIEAKTQSCPVNQTDILSYGDGADFYVKDIAVTAIANPPPCNPR